jgi:hypothetical protein
MFATQSCLEQQVLTNLGALMKPKHRATCFFALTAGRKLGWPRAWRCFVAACFALAAVFSTPRILHADEGGVSFWVPGLYGSLAALPAVPGWSLAMVNYYTSVSAGGSLSAAREVTLGRLNPTITVNLNANLKANPDSVLINPSYVFTSPVFGGQFALSMAGIVGRSTADISGTLTASVGPLAVTRQGTIDDGRTGFGDLYPQATLRWNSGANNWMTYVTGDIPVGMYSTTNLANLGIGHGAVDGGVGYTYFNPQDGHEFSVSRASPTISSTQPPVIATATIGISIGAPRNS